MLNEDNYKIIGHDLQAVNIKLEEGNSVLADPGNLVYMTDNVKMEVTLSKKDLTEKLFGGIKRLIAGENFFLTSFSPTSGSGEITLSSAIPGKIIPVRVPKEGMICEKQSYLCSDREINIEVALSKKLGFGLFGREGFILQKLTGNGIVFIQASGMVIRKTLSEGEKIKLDPGCIAAFDSTIDYDIEYVGSVKTVFWGGTGLFFVTLTGPGNVYIQTLPLAKLSRKLLIASKFYKASSRS